MLGVNVADVRALGWAGWTLNVVRVGLLCGMTIVDGMVSPAASSGSCLMVLGIEEGDTIMEMRTGVVPVLIEVPEEASKVMEHMEVTEHKVDMEILVIREVVVAIMVIVMVIMEVMVVIDMVIVEVMEIIGVMAIVEVIVGKTMTHEIHINII